MDVVCMIGHSDIASIVEEYDRLKLRIGMTASHSALDICDGAIEEGFFIDLVYLQNLNNRFQYVLIK